MRGLVRSRARGTGVRRGQAMAQFHMRVKIISRSGGGSAVEGAAYRSGGVVRGSVIKGAAYRAGERLMWAR
jgi:hypothetical protein